MSRLLRPRLPLTSSLPDSLTTYVRVRSVEVLKMPSRDLSQLWNAELADTSDEQPGGPTLSLSLTLNLALTLTLPLHPHLSPFTLTLTLNLTPTPNQAGWSSRSPVTSRWRRRTMVAWYDAS